PTSSWGRWSGSPSWWRSSSASAGRSPARRYSPWPSATRRPASWGSTSIARSPRPTPCRPFSPASPACSWRRSSTSRPRWARRSASRRSPSRSSAAWKVRAASSWLASCTGSSRRSWPDISGRASARSSASVSSSSSCCCGRGAAPARRRYGAGNVTGAGRLVVALGLVAAAGVPLATSNTYYLFIAMLIGISIVVTTGLNILAGASGQVSLGQAGFYALGAYASAIITTRLGLGFWIGLPAAIVLGAAVGVVLALASLRVSGPYLAMVTIAFGIIVEHGLIEWDALTKGFGGIASIPRPRLGALELTLPFYYYVVALTVVVSLLFGGLGRVTGPLVGSMVLIVLPELLHRFSDYRLVMYGVLLLGSIYFLPQGVVGALSTWRRSRTPYDRRAEGGPFVPPQTPLFAR